MNTADQVSSLPSRMAELMFPIPCLGQASHMVKTSNPSSEHQLCFVFHSSAFSWPRSRLSFGGHAFNKLILVPFSRFSHAFHPLLQPICLLILYYPLVYTTLPLPSSARGSFLAGSAKPISVRCAPISKSFTEYVTKHR